MNAEKFRFPQRENALLAITNVTVIPMDQPGTLKNQTVVIEDGWIRAVEPASNINTATMQVVDGYGKYLLPALTDMHVHYWMPGDMALFLANGVTTVRNMSGAPFHLALQKEVESGARPGPRIVTTSPTLEADEFMLPMWQYLNEPSQAHRLVAHYAQRGYQQIKVLNLINRETLCALGAACREHYLRLTGHCPQAMTYEAAIDAGMSCFEHLLGIWKGHLRDGCSPAGQSNADLDVIEAMAHHLDYEAIRRLAGRMAAQQIWNCQTLVTDQFMCLGQAQGLTHPTIAPRLQYVPPIVLPLWEWLDPTQRQGERLTRWQQAIQSRIQASLQVIKLLHQEGAPLLVGTDTSVRFVIQGFSVHDELANFVCAGLPPFEAIRCATSEPARFLDRTAEVGTVTKNKRADLLLVAENPLDDIGALRKIEDLFVNGFHLTRADLATMLEMQASTAKRGSIEVIVSAAKEREQCGTGVIAGTLLEMTGAKPKGKLTYRHERLAEHGWNVHERYEFEQNSIYEIGGARSRTTQVELMADLRVKSASMVEQSFAGVACIEVHYVEANRYLVCQEGEDGFVSTYEILAPEALRPDISLLVTIALHPAFASTFVARSAPQALLLLPSIEPERLQIGQTVCEVVNDPQTAAKGITIKSHWERRSQEGVYQFGKDGQLESCQYGWSQFLPESS